MRRTPSRDAGVEFRPVRRSARAARFPVFLFSGHASDELALEMLQGLIADLNRKSRASGLHLPASESGWGSTLASTWMTGFPARTGFARGLPGIRSLAFRRCAHDRRWRGRFSSLRCRGSEQVAGAKKRTETLIALAKTQRAGSRRDRHDRNRRSRRRPRCGGLFHPHRHDLAAVKAASASDCRRQPRSSA